MNVTTTFETMQAGFNADAADGLNTVIQWVISGHEAGVWTFVIADRTCELMRGSHKHPSLTLSVNDRDWLAIVEGRLDAVVAFATGKVKMKGEIMLAARIHKLFPTIGQR